MSNGLRGWRQAQGAFRRPFLLWLVCSLLVVGSGYRLYISTASERFREQSHLQGELLASQTAARIRLIVSALEMFSADPHLATYVAAGGTLPPYARARIQPAVDLLAHNLPVTDWTVGVFANGPRLLVEPKESRYREVFGELLLSWAQSRDPNYQVRLTENNTLHYAAPVTYEGAVHGFIAMSFAKQVLQVTPGAFQMGLREERSGAVVTPFVEAEASIYRETFAVGVTPSKGDWLLDLSRPDGQFWDSAGVFQARLTAALSLLLALLTGLSVLSSLDRRAALIASRAKSDMLSNVSHEIRNPLTGIIGLTERTLETPLVDAQREHLNSIAQAAKGLMNLLDDLLDHAKVEAGMLEFHPVPSSLRALVSQTVSTFQALGNRTEVELRAVVPEDLPDIFIVDPQRLRQVMVNLLSNAMKFTERGTVGLSVTSQGRDDEGRLILRFTVSDTGAGIAPERLQQIFEAFRQADPMVSQKYGGTGLGLAICREFVRRWGGEIWAESQLGKGSRFHFTAHLAVVPEVKPEAEKKTPGLRILLAEDGTINLKLGRSLLEDMGHQVTTAKDGTQVLRLLEQQPFDMILMDLGMPHLDGFETAKQIRASSYGHLKIVALTGSADNGDKQRSLAAGMNGHLVKPLTERSFSRMVSELRVGESRSC